MPRLSKIGAAALAAFGWTTGAAAVTVDFLVIAGGGGGGNDVAGGGGAGGYRCSVTGESSGGGASAEGKLNLSLTDSYTVTVGAGGAGAVDNTANGVNGTNSVFSTITSTGGGGGGSNTGNPANNGGSGGGAGGNTTGGTGNANQGFAGGSSSAGDRPGGGGGAGAVGGAGSSGTIGNGGAGVSSSINGTATGRAGGGAGGYSNVLGTGGTATDGGGGSSSTVGLNGTANTGGGGGGGGQNGTRDGGQGGSGVVIISYVGAQQFGGGVVTSSGGNTIHTFTTSGTLSPLSSLTANFLVVAGGGGGGGAYGGGGGAGGLRSSVTNTGGGGSLESTLTIDTNSIYLVTVGAGGVGAQYTVSQANSGSNSAFLSITSTGGGRSGLINTAGASGGSGGGGGSNSGTGAAGGSGTANQGFAGGTGAGYDGVNGYAGGGGGGAGAVGQSRTAGQNTGGNGGAGVTVAITGSSIGYAGGGGGSGYTTSGGTATDGGGAGADYNVIGSSGSANRGGGGGGGGAFPDFSGSGGSGVVIISYPGSTQQMAGGTVTVAGGNVIHTFTSSGYLTPIVLTTNSLRFRSSASASLTRTPTVSGSTNKWTFSAWVKRGTLGSNAAIAGSYKSSQWVTQLYFMANDTFRVYISNDVNSTYIDYQTSAVYRDPAAWYHIVVSVDNTTSTTGFALYVNGSQVTSFGTSSNNLSQNAGISFNQASASTGVGVSYNTAGSAFGYFDGELAEVNSIDGQALTPNSFGTSNGLGVWQPIRYGGSYGTNGFYLPFTGSSSFYGSFNGSSQYLTIAQNAAFNMGSGDFTIESWVYFNASGRAAIIGQINSSGLNSSGSFYFERNASNFLRILVASGGTGYEVVGTTIVSSGQWLHVAAVRNGNNLSCYLNGVSQGTVSVTGVSLNSSTENVQINGYGTSTGLVFAGAMSNVRIVKGTAVYTSNFIPPTANLTAISGTSLLTLQNATIVDNSTNAFSITNTNSVTTSQAYPFTMLANQSKDYSPNGNNWTNNNIGLLAGSTLDIMTDVPTLTSATAANYAVLNPLKKPSTSTISNGNLTVVWDANGGEQPNTIAVSSGKWYWEQTQDSYLAAPGIILSTATPSNSSISQGYHYYGGNGNFYTGISSVSYGATFGSGDVIGVALDLDTNQITFYKNNVSQGAKSIVAGEYNADFCSAGTNTINANFGQRPFAYTPPTDFKALNTFNLTTPAIGATPATTANKYFNAVTYAGAGAGTVITTGFYPDFAWMKNRTAAFSNFVQDSVRGGGVYLLTDEPDPDAAVSPSSTFSSTGLTIPFNSSYASNSSYNFVAWAWNANSGSTVSNTAGAITSTVSANTTAGFSIVTYTGTGGTGTTTVGHGCQVGGIATAPSMVIIKRRNASANWATYHTGLTSTSYYLFFDVNTGEANYGSTFISPSSSTLTIAADSSLLNASGGTYVAYCFAQVAGYSAFGSYLGNGSTNGTFVYTGFRPRFIILKHRGAGSDAWILMDTSTQTYNVVGNFLQPSQPDQELNTVICDFLSNGFKLRETYTTINTGSNTYIYMAFAENPFKYANAR